MDAQNSGGDRNANRIPVMEDGLRGWSYDLFDCFADPRTCMWASGQLLYRHLQYPNSLVIPGALSCCCCCYSYSRNKQRLQHLETHGTPRREPVKKYNCDCNRYCSFGPAALALQVRLLSIPSPLTLITDFRVSIGHQPV